MLLNLYYQSWQRQTMLRKNSCQSPWFTVYADSYSFNCHHTVISLLAQCFEILRRTCWSSSNLRYILLRHVPAVLNPERYTNTRELGFFSLGFLLVTGLLIFLLYKHSWSVRTFWLVLPPVWLMYGQMLREILEYGICSLSSTSVNQCASAFPLAFSLWFPE